MNKLLTKIVGAVASLALVIGVGIGIVNNNNVNVVEAAPGDEVYLPTESFDNNDDFSSGSNYQSTVTQGPENKTWTIYYGCFSTSSKITGTRSAAIRLYYNSDNLGYLKTDFSIGYVSKVSFKVKASTSNSTTFKLNVQYSLNGSSWSFMKQTSGSGADYSAITPGSSASLVTLYMPTAVSGNQEAVYLKWSVDASSTKPTTSNAQLTIDDITIYYIEQAIAGTYSVTFNSNGGSSVPTQNVPNSGSASADEPSAPTKSGYTFAGWYSDEALTSLYDFDSNVTESITLYAKWQKVSLESSYSPSTLLNGNGYRISGEVTAKAGSSFFIQNGDSAMQIYDSSVASAVSVGNTIDLFGTYQSGNNAEIKNVVYYEITSADTTNSQTPISSLNEATEANRYKYFEIAQIQLDSAFGENKMASIKGSDVVVYYSNTSHVNAGGSFVPGDYAADNYVSIKGVIIKYNSTIELQISSIAKLTQYIVSFDGNASGVSLTSPQTVLENNKALEPSNPIREPDENYNYSFAGWYKNAECTGDLYNFNDSVTSSFTLYAKWTRTNRTAKEVVESLETKTSLTYHYSKRGAIDRLTRETTGIANGSNSYTSWSGIVGKSGASYSGKSAGGNDSIQLRTSGGDEGIIVTSPNSNHFYATKIVLNWHGDTVNGRIVDVYGSDSSYEEVSDLFDEEKRGTLIGSSEFNNHGDAFTSIIEINSLHKFKYVGIKSHDQALYLTSVEIQWGAEPAYVYSNVGIRFTGQISTARWNRLNSESSITGYGIMFAETSQLASKEIEEWYDLARASAANVDASFTAVAGKTYKMVNGSEVKCYYTAVPGEKEHPAQDGDDYVWSLFKSIDTSNPSTAEANLAKQYTGVAYIRTTADEIIFLDEITKSAVDIALDLYAADVDLDETLEGSLSYLADMA